MNETTIKTVALIGAGRMGMPIVGHLAKAGYRVLVNDRSEARREEVERRGASWVTDISKLAAEAQAILICVGYDREVRELMHATGGLLASAQRSTVIAVLSTINPKTVQELAKEAQERGIYVIDSTVCRGGEAADQGTLLSFVGGSKEIVERITPVLSAYSADVVHSGGVGTAQVAKAANNLILWACLVANHEGLALAQRFDVNVEALRQALLISSATNGALSNWGKQTMAWAEDDMAIVSEMAEECGIALPQSGVVREICRALKPRRYRLEEYGR